jgi:hypothetical protein
MALPAHPARREGTARARTRPGGHGDTAGKGAHAHARREQRLEVVVRAARLVNRHKKAASGIILRAMASRNNDRLLWLVAIAAVAGICLRAIGLESRSLFID